MHFDDFQDQSQRHAKYKDQNTINGIVYCSLGLCGEAGEVANRIKKVIRDQEGKLTVEDIMFISLEMGDCLWYLAALANEINISLDGVARLQMEKLVQVKK